MSPFLRKGVFARQIVLDSHGVGLDVGFPISFIEMLSHYVLALKVSDEAFR